ncbi:MAG: hypothetical protein ACQPRJ_02465 [Solitalea-like symbiont of Acarus siro]
MEIYENPRLRETQKFEELKKSMLADFKDAYLGTKDAADHIVLRALSNGGSADFTNTINPDGRTYKVDYQMPKDNKKKVADDWSEDNITSVDCLKELR